MNERIETPTGTPAPSPRTPGEPYTQLRDERGEPMTRGAMEPAGKHGGHSREPLTRTERLLVTMFVTMFATMLAAGALGFTTLSGQMLELQNQMLDFQKQIGELSERMARVETRLTSVETRLTSVETQIQTRLGPAPDTRNPAGL